MPILQSLLAWIREHVRGFHTAIGVYLAIGLACSIGALLAFAALALLVVGGATQRMDEAILLWMYERSSPFLDSWALKITALGSTVVVMMVVLVASAFLWTSRHRYSVLLLWVAMLGSAVLSTVLKAAFARPRPELWDRVYAGHASFPSGHAMSAVVIYGTMAYLLLRLERTRALRRLTAGVTVLVILLIGVTRIYLGVHYPSDVIAGYVAALSWAGFCALGIEAIQYFRRRRPGIGEEEEDLERGVPRL
jgi:undecaprenyl-diphosphatase